MCDEGVRRAADRLGRIRAGDELPERAAQVPGIRAAGDDEIGDVALKLQRSEAAGALHGGTDDVVQRGDLLRRDDQLHRRESPRIRSVDSGHVRCFLAAIEHAHIGDPLRAVFAGGVRRRGDVLARRERERPCVEARVAGELDEERP